MANRLVAVDDNFNLPPEVQSQLTSNFEYEFQTLHDEAVTAASNAGASATVATDASASAADSAVSAAQSAAEAAVPTDQAVDEGIDRAISDGKLPKTWPYLESVKLQIIGHSYTIVPYPYCSPGGEQVSRVGKRIDSGTVKSWGRSGSYAIDTYARLVSPAYLGSEVWTPNQPGIILLQNTINELGSPDAGNTQYRSMWAHALRSLIEVSRAKEFRDADHGSITYSGSWSVMAANESRAHALNDNMKFATSANAATATATIRTGVDDLSICVAIGDPTYDLAPVQLVYGGTVIAEFNGKNQIPAGWQGAGDSGTRAYVFAQWRVKNIHAITGGGINDLVLRRKPGTTGMIFCGGWMYHDTPTADVFVAKEPPRAGTGAAYYNANIGWYNAKTDEIVAEYTSGDVHSVDLAPGWTSAMVSSIDSMNFHPNDLGMSFLAGKWVEAIDQHITDWKSGVVML